jgi:hypothetical protein
VPCSQWRAWPASASPHPPNPPAARPRGTSPGPCSARSRSPCGPPSPPAAPRPLILSGYGSAAVTAVFVAQLGWLLAETHDGSVLGLAERLTSSIQTCWPFIIAVALRRS